MGQFSKRSIRVSCLALAFTALLFCGYRLALGQSSPAKKSINVVTIFLSEAGIAETIRMEDALGSVQVRPYLEAHGYKVENVFSMHRLAVSNGGLTRALITAFDNEPTRDDARILVVTMAAEAGTEPYTVRMNFVLLDSYISGLVTARKNGIAAQVEKLWDYESEPITAPPAEAAKKFGSRLNMALNLFNGQYQPRTNN